jgi:hypothetical protein
LKPRYWLAIDKPLCVTQGTYKEAYTPSLNPPYCSATNPKHPIDAALALNNILLCLTNISLSKKIAKSLLVELNAGSILAVFAPYASRFSPPLLRFVAHLGRNMIKQTPKEDVPILIKTNLLEAVLKTFADIVPPTEES